MPWRQAARQLTQRVLGSAAPCSTRSQRRLEPCCPRLFAEGRQIYKRACIFIGSEASYTQASEAHSRNQRWDSTPSRVFLKISGFASRPLVRQLAPDHAKRRRPLPPGGSRRKPKNQWKSKLCSRGLLEAILDDFGRPMSDFGSKMRLKSIQNGPNMSPKRIPDRVFDFELVFRSIFINFWAVFWMIFRCCFASSHHVNEKCECSESPHFYNRF